ncbi:CoA-binding protein [Streptomyces sp. NPDC088124]|uniref:CoA-binding protein n=1 Tax=Streptomyces sp. NPDC088124 TaxID=3154654 RepID=UPI00343DDEB9
MDAERAETGTAGTGSGGPAGARPEDGPGAGARPGDGPGDPATIREILRRGGDTWAVVGLSANTSRAAYGVAAVLQRYGKRVVPVHPKAETVHGERGYASLADIPFPVDVVDVFVNSRLAGAVADEAVAIGAKAVWFQLGVIDEQAYERTRAAGLAMVMDRCPAIEIPRLG